MKLRHFLQNLLVFVFWITVYYLLSLIINNPILLPAPHEVFAALVRLLPKGAFLAAAGLSILRILAGFSLGVLTGFAFAVLSAKSALMKKLFFPFFTVLRSTPLASSVMILWVLFGSGAVPTVVSSIIVSPIIYASTLAGISSIDKNLSEVAEVFRFDFGKRVRLLYAPTVWQSVFPSLVTAAGMAWKAGVAAEIIAYTKNSIGRGIYDAKAAIESAEMFAWTLAVILISIAIETGLGYLAKRSGIRHAGH